MPRFVAQRAETESAFRTLREVIFRFFQDGRTAIFPRTEDDVRHSLQRLERRETFVSIERRFVDQSSYDVVRKRIRTFVVRTRHLENVSVANFDEQKRSNACATNDVFTRKKSYALRTLVVVEADGTFEASFFERFALPLRVVSHQVHRDVFHISPVVVFGNGARIDLVCVLAPRVFQYDFLRRHLGGQIF